MPEPRYYGFNFQWMVSRQEGRGPGVPDPAALDFVAGHAFDFVRIPTDYRFWTEGVDYFHPNEAVFQAIDGYIEAVHERGMHFSLNLHRAPGYCINRPEIETHNLWTDEVAQDAFVFIWETFARRYKGLPSSGLSFDLLNEPPNEGERGFDRAVHERLMRRTVAAIRAIDPDREIVLNGIGGGHYALPEFADLGVVHSGRGYQPMAVSHYGAGWWSGSPGLPIPEYPGLVYEGRSWDRAALRDFYEPWREIERTGVRIQIGECGCHSKTPNDVALRWLSDLFGVYREFGWGYCLWNFVGSFGIVGHGREGARFEERDGFLVDVDLLKILEENRV